MRITASFRICVRAHVYVCFGIEVDNNEIRVYDHRSERSALRSANTNPSQKPSAINGTTLGSILANHIDYRGLALSSMAQIWEREL